jgi:hypothetical protein
MIFDLLMLAAGDKNVFFELYSLWLKWTPMYVGIIDWWSPKPHDMFMYTYVLLPAYLSYHATSLPTSIAIPLFSLCADNMNCCKWCYFSVPSVVPRYKRSNDVITLIF